MIVAARSRLRLGLRAGLYAVFLGLAVYYLLPQVDQLEQTLQALRSADVGWLLAATGAAAATFLASAVAVIGAAGRPLPAGRTLAVELAGAAMNRLTPAGIGRAAVLARYYQRSGLPRTQAVTAVGVNLAAGALVHTVALAAGSLLLVTNGWGVTASQHLPRHWPWLLVLTAALLVAGLAAGTTRPARALLRPLTDARQQLAAAVRRPESAAALLGGGLAVNAGFVLSLAASLLAFGGHASLPAVAVVYLAASAVASAAPTPGGIGAMEAGLLAGLTRFGVATGPAVAGVLTYRLLTYWLPILPGLVCLRRLQRDRRL